VSSEANTEHGSPFIRTSVETTVISDVGGSPVVRVEEEEDVGVET